MCVGGWGGGGYLSLLMRGISLLAEADELCLDLIKRNHDHGLGLAALWFEVFKLLLVGLRWSRSSSDVLLQSRSV